MFSSFSEGLSSWWSKKEEEEEGEGEKREGEGQEGEKEQNQETGWTKGIDGIINMILMPYTLLLMCSVQV